MSTEEVDYQALTQFDHKLKAKMHGLSSSIAKRDNDESAFRDSFHLTTTVTTDTLHDILAAMGIANTKFIENLPDEVPTVDLVGCHFEEHSLRITSAGKNMARIDSVDVSKVKVTKNSNETFEITMVVKGVPQLDEHFKIERVLLDTHAGAFFLFEFGSPAQEEMFKPEAGDGDIPASVLSGLSIVES